MRSVPNGSVRPMPDSPKEASRSCQSTSPVLMPSWVGPQSHSSTGSTSRQITMPLQIMPISSQTQNKRPVMWCLGPCITSGISPSLSSKRCCPALVPGEDHRRASTNICQVMTMTGKMPPSLYRTTRWATVIPAKPEQMPRCHKMMLI